MSKEKSSAPDRVREFAHFFKRYMSLSTLVVAALPLPLTGTGAIPSYASQTWLLATYTSLFCFLLLGYIFYRRDKLALLLFPTLQAEKEGARIRRLQPTLIAWLPALLSIAAASFVFLYHDVLEDSIVIAKAEDLMVQTGTLATPESANILLFGSPEERLSLAREIHSKAIRFSVESPLNSERERIPFGRTLMLYHLLIFVSAEAAFILMALKEYLQDLLGLEDQSLIRGSWSLTAKFPDSPAGA